MPARQILRKTVAEVLYANVDFSARLVPDERIVSQGVGGVPVGMTIANFSTSENGEIVQMKVRDGVAGTYADVRVTVNTSRGQTLTEDCRIHVRA